MIDILVGVLVAALVVIVWGGFSVMAYQFHREDGHSKFKSALLAPLIPFQLWWEVLIHGSGEG